MIEQFTQLEVLFVLTVFSSILGFVKLIIAVLKEWVDYSDDKSTNRIMKILEYIISLLLSILLIPCIV